MDLLSTRWGQCPSTWWSVPGTGRLFEVLRRADAVLPVSAAVSAVPRRSLFLRLLRAGAHFFRRVADLFFLQLADLHEAAIGRCVGRECEPFRDGVCLLAGHVLDDCEGVVILADGSGFDEGQDAGHHVVSFRLVA